MNGPLTGSIAAQIAAPPGHCTAAADATLALLWERVRKQGDMPGFRRAINAILGAMRGEEDKEFCLTHTVLSDPILTQKVLRLANSGMYAAFGQRISTVSRAVLVLGADAIGHLALGLKLIEELSGTAPIPPAPTWRWKSRCWPGWWRGRWHPARRMPRKRWSARCCTRWAA